MSLNPELATASASQYERPPGFVFRKPVRNATRDAKTSLLHCENVSLLKLAQRYGTPLYVYSARTIRERLAAFEQAFRHFPHTVCYSVKANSNLSILRLLAREGCGFDVVSGGELERVLLADRHAAKKIVFSGVGKTRAEMFAALKAGILLFNVESESELAALGECAARTRTTARVALRVNPNVAADTHPYISTGLRKHKFGVPITIARSLYAEAAREKYLKAAGVSVHIGSQITDVAPFAEAVSRVADLIQQLRSDGHKIDYVDAGGGLGIAYENPETNFEECASRYARAVIEPLRGLNIHLLLEPGRAIIGPAGVLLTTVLYRKQNGDKRFLIVDAAMNDLIRPALYSAHHEIVPVVRPKQSERDSCEIVDVVGPICESGDTLARDRELPRVEEGDLLAILDVGAYGMVLASNYNSRPRPAEVLVSGKSAKLIRRREGIGDLLRAER
jgi:diaminopimelate decarboxylase